MTSPQTRSRENKIRMFKQIISLTADLLTLNKGDLDSIDTRYVKKIVGQLEGWKPREKHTIKNVS